MAPCNILAFYLGCQLTCFREAFVRRFAPALRHPTCRSIAGDRPLRHRDRPILTQAQSPGALGRAAKQTGPGNSTTPQVIGGLAAAGSGMGVPAGAGEGLRAYYQSKIEELELAIRDKQHNLHRMEAQRNELNSRGAE